MNPHARYRLDVMAEPKQDVLLRVAGVLARQQAAVSRLSMRDRDGVRQIEIEADVDPERMELLCGRLRNLVSVLDVVPWPYRPAQ